MKSSLTEYHSLKFDLAIEDGWPPVATEVLQCQWAGAGYRIASIPLFVKDLSIGDVIAGEINEEGFIENWRHIEKSTHSTVWILRMKSGESIGKTLNQLRNMGCDTVSAESVGMYAADIPPHIQMEEVDRVLESLDSEDAGVAYPSFRHADS